MKAPTAENAQMAADELAQSLVKNLSQFSTVEQPDRGDYFERNELLLASPTQIRKSVAGLAEAVVKSNPQLTKHPAGARFSREDDIRNLCIKPMCKFRT